VASYAIMVTSE